MGYDILILTMANKNKEWKLIETKLVYDRFVHLYEDKIKLPTGEVIDYTINRSGGGAAILLAPNPTSFLLAYQYRYPIDNWIYDLPGGGIKKGESPEEAAIRECIEETGYRPLRLKKLIEYYPSPGRSDGLLHIFFCDVAEKVKDGQSSNADPAEHVEGIAMKKGELEGLIKKNDIVDPALLIAWHTARLHGDI